MIHQESPTIIRIPAHASAFDVELIGLIQTRIAALNEARDVIGKSLIFVAEGPLEDEPLTGEIESQPLNLHDVLCEKLKILSRLVQDIANHRLASIWISSDHCSGIWWEIALACSTRIWFGESCRLGFPEVRQGQISSLGVVAKACVRNHNVLDFISENADFSPLQAHQSGWVDALFPTSSMIEVGQFVEVLQSGSQFRTATGQLAVAANKRSSAWWQGFLYSRSTSLTAIPRISGSLQALRDLVKSSDGSNLGRQIESVLIPLRAREYLASLAGLAGQHRMQTSIRSMDRPRLKSVQIGASSILPPTLVMRRIIDHRLGVMLFDANVGSLVRSSEVLESRLRKVMGDQEWKRFRERQLVLFHSDRPIAKAEQICTLNWAADESVELSLQGQTLRGIVLEGSDSAAQIGPVELSSQFANHREYEVQIDAVIGQHLFTNWLFDGNIPVSSWVRLVALIHLDELCRSFAIPITRAIGELGEKRWRFLGHDQRVAGFLRNRQLYWPGSHDSFTHCGISMEAKQLKSLEFSLFGKNTMAPAEAFKGKDLSLDTIAKVIAGTIYVVLCELEISDRTCADRLVSSALGFASHGGSVRQYLQDFGGKAVLNYAKQIFKIAEIESVFGQHFRP